MSALVAVALLVRRSWSALAAWLVAVLGGEALNLLPKDLFARPRPHFEHPLVVEASYGFPSGQARGSPVVYGMLACFAVLTWTGRGNVAFPIVPLRLQSQGTVKADIEGWLTPYGIVGSYFEQTRKGQR